MNAPLDESTKRSLEAAAKLVRGSEDAILVMEFVYRLGFMDGLLKMALTQAQRTDKPLRQAP